MDGLRNSFNATPHLPWSPTLTRDFQSKIALEKMRWDRDLGGGVLSFLDSRDLFLTTYGKERVKSGVCLIL